MWIKVLLLALFLVSVVGAYVVEPFRKGEQNFADSAERRGVADNHLRLLTWNIGNGDLESETRAHTEDLAAVAKVILDNDADAVALQELAGEDQLKLLLAHLKNRYRGYVSRPGSSDRVEAVLVKNYNERGEEGDPAARGAGRVSFSDVPAGNRFAAAAAFRVKPGLPEVVFVSAHANAFSASRRRTFVAEVADWTRANAKSKLGFIAGDFNFEVSLRNKNDLFSDDAKHDSESYAYLLKYFRDFGLDAGETSINDRRIDYVYGPATKAVSLRRAEVLRGAAVGRMDHWPLLVEIGL